MQFFLLVWTSINMLLSIVVLTAGRKGIITLEVKNLCDEIICESNFVQICVYSILMMTVALPAFLTGVIAGIIECINGGK